MNSLQRAIVGACIPIVLQAQQSPTPRDKVCDAQVVVVRQARSGPELRGAIRHLGACQPTPAMAIEAANAYRRLSSTTDTAELEGLLALATRSDNPAALGAVLTVVEDASATGVARIAGFAALARLVMPGRAVRYSDMLGGIDESGLSRATCSSGMIAGKVREPRMPDAIRERIRVVSRAVAGNIREKPDVRSAASCL